MGLCLALIQSVGGVVNNTSEDAASVLGGNILVLVLLAAFLKSDVSGRKKKLDKLKTELDLGSMQVRNTNSIPRL